MKLNTLVRSGSALLAMSLAATMTFTTGCASSEGRTPETTAPVATTVSATVATQTTAAPATETTGATTGVGYDSGVSLQLYEDFMKGNTTATYHVGTDHASYLTMPASVADGTKLTLTDLLDQIKNSCDMALTMPETMTTNTIDCGMDGMEEYLITIPLEGPEIFTLFVVLKDVDGELQICYTTDQWSRNEVIIDKNGLITTSGSGGASIHITTYAYLDAEGEYHFHYGVEENYAPISLFAYINDDFTEISFDDLAMDCIMVLTYWFEENTATPKYVYSYRTVDEALNDISEPTDYTDSNPVFKRFLEYGITPLSMEEMDQLIADHGKEIQYPAE